ncbi:MAG: hypothetical protein JXR76_11320 [Deltaproteobacteria bacterium]|nr:hypothetical protein [Deltaproteobacteria bacterium]
MELLIKYPMTASMIFRASRNFKNPYGSIGTLRNELKSLHDGEWIQRQKLPSVRKGEREFIYFPSKKIKRVDCFEEHQLSDATFEGFSGHEWHAEAVSDFMSHVERCAGTIKERVQILCTVQDRYFQQAVHVTFLGDDKQTALEPDHVLVVKIDGAINLLFLELWNQPALANPRKPASISRSIRFRMAKYKSFAGNFRQNHQVRQWETEFRHRFKGFRVLMVTTRGDAPRNRMLSIAKNDGYRSMFYFATMDDIRQSANIFTKPVWHLPNGKVRGLIDD